MFNLIDILILTLVILTLDILILTLSVIGYGLILTIYRCYEQTEFDKWLGNRLFIYFLIAWICMIIYFMNNFMNKWNEPTPSTAIITFLVFWSILILGLFLEYIIFRIVRYSSKYESQQERLDL